MVHVSIPIIKLSTKTYNTVLEQSLHFHTNIQRELPLKVAVIRYLKPTEKYTLKMLKDSRQNQYPFHGRK